MKLFNKAAGSISETKMGVLSEWSLRIALIFFFIVEGWPKAEVLFTAPGEAFSYIGKMALFGGFPLVSTYLITIMELLLIPLCILLGGFKFLGQNAKTFSTLGGFMATCTMLIIIFVFHFGVKGDGILDVKYQLSLLAISLYFLFK